MLITITTKELQKHFFKVIVLASKIEQSKNEPEPRKQNSLNAMKTIPAKVDNKSMETLIKLCLYWLKGNPFVAIIKICNKSLENVFFFLSVWVNLCFMVYAYNSKQLT